MKVLQAHNRYRKPGGEDTVLANEARLLREHGHQVELLEVHNNEDDPASLPAKFRLARNTLWSATGAELMTAALQRYRPDIVHVHNTFNQLSPRVLRTAVVHGVPVVQTLHNFRLVCANGLLLREGLPCELCIEGGRLNAVRHRCYRGSRAGSAVVSLSGALHMRLGTFSQRGVRVLALTEFARRLFLRSGLEARALRVKPNFVYPPECPPLPLADRMQTVVFVGRLAAEKGVDLLLDAWRRVAAPGWVLELIGEGELRPAAATLDPSVRCLGWLAPAEVMARVGSARFLVMASRWYEGLPMVLLEAFSAATPVIVPRLGAMGEVMEEGVNGHGFEAGSAAALAGALGHAITLPPAAWQALSAGALRSYQDSFSPAANHSALLAIYREAMEEVAA